MEDGMAAVLEAARQLISEDPRAYSKQLDTLPGFAELPYAEQTAFRRVPAEKIARYLATAEVRMRNSSRAARIT